jgi:hypothetical protein
MQKLIPILLALLMAFPADGKVPAGATGTVQYEVRYRLGGITTKVATATISLENGRWEEQSAYHTGAVIRAASVFRLFMNAEYIADAYLSSSSLDPLYYLNPFKKNGKEGKVEYLYERAARTIRAEVVRPPEDPVTASIPMDDRTMDLLTLLQYVRFRDFSGPVSLKLLMNTDTRPATLTPQGIDTERFPGVRAERFLLKLHGRGLMENGSGDEITLWRSTDGNRRLLGLETELGKNATMVAAIKE